MSRDELLTAGTVGCRPRTVARIVNALAPAMSNIVTEYRDRLPESAREEIEAAWGEEEGDEPIAESLAIADEAMSSLKDFLGTLSESFDLVVNAMIEDGGDE